MEIIVFLYFALLVLLNLKVLIHQAWMFWPIRKKPLLIKPELFDGQIAILYPIRNEPLWLIERFFKSLSTIPPHQRNFFYLYLIDDYDKPIQQELMKISHLIPIRWRYLRRIRDNRIDLGVGRAKNKAGALNHALQNLEPNTPFFAVFDADHQVKDFGSMVRAAVFLKQNPDIWAVQSRWDMANTNNTLVSWLQEVTMGIHLYREQTWRSADKADLIAIINGAGFVARVSDVLKVGGMPERSVTEDVDLSFILYAKGKKVIIDSFWVTLIDNPDSWHALKKQWQKWAKANGQVCRFHWSVPLRPWYKKLYWLLWQSAFLHAPLKYVYTIFGTYRFFAGEWTLVEWLCVLPHIGIWLAASFDWNDKINIRRMLLYFLHYILEFGILHVQIRSFYQGFLRPKVQYEFESTPKN